MRRSVLLVTVLAAVLAGCSSTTGGAAVPGTRQSGPPDLPTAGPTGAPTTSRSEGTNPLEETSPCDLLTSEAQAQLGLGGREERKVGQARSCRWTRRDSAGDLQVFSVGILDKVGIDDIPANRNPKKLPNIGDHEAVQTLEGGGEGSCTVILGVTESTRVDTGMNADIDTPAACDLALQLARLVEPELP